MSEEAFISNFGYLQYLIACIYIHSHFFLDLFTGKHSIFKPCLICLYIFKTFTRNQGVEKCFQHSNLLPAPTIMLLLYQYKSFYFFGHVNKPRLFVIAYLKYDIECF